MTTCSTPHISEADSFLIPCDWVCPEWLKQASTQCSAILACPSNPAADQPRTHGYFSSLYCDETQHPVTVYEQTATVFSHALKFGKCSTQLSQSISQIWSFSQLRNSLQWVRCLHRNLFVFTHKLGRRLFSHFCEGIWELCKQGERYLGIRYQEQPVTLNSAREWLALLLQHLWRTQLPDELRLSVWLNLFAYSCLTCKMETIMFSWLNEFWEIVH